MSLINDGSFIYRLEQVCPDVIEKFNYLKVTNENVWEGDDKVDTDWLSDRGEFICDWIENGKENKRGYKNSKSQRHGRWTIMDETGIDFNRYHEGVRHGTQLSFFKSGTKQIYEYKDGK